MTTYAIRRILQSIFVLFLLSIIFFLLVRFEFGFQACTIPTIECESSYHADLPITSQYVIWLGQVVHGDFGLATTGQPVMVRIEQTLPLTALLLGVSLVIQQLLAIPLGILAAVRQYSGFDLALTFLSYAALSIPSFLLGVVFINVGALQFHWFPTGGNEDVALPLLFSGDWWSSLLSDPGFILGDLVRHLLAPVLVLSALGVANDSRIVRAAMLQVMHQDYVRTARAKGVRRRAIIFKHAFRNALLPVITNIGLYLPTLIGGVIVVELVFRWGGVGSAFGSLAPSFAAGGYFGVPDTGFLEAVLLISSIAVLAVNLITDLLYAWLDPRIRLGSGGES